MPDFMDWKIIMQDVQHYLTWLWFEAFYSLPESIRKDGLTILSEFEFGQVSDIISRIGNCQFQNSNSRPDLHNSICRFALHWIQNQQFKITLYEWFRQYYGVKPHSLKRNLVQLLKENSQLKDLPPFIVPYLSPDVLTNISRFSNADTLRNLSQTSKDFNQISETIDNRAFQYGRLKRMIETDDADALSKFMTIFKNAKTFSPNQFLSACLEKLPLAINCLRRAYENNWLRFVEDASPTYSTSLFHHHPISRILQWYMTSVRKNLLQNTYDTLNFLLDGKTILKKDMMTLYFQSEERQQLEDALPLSIMGLFGYADYCFRERDTIVYMDGSRLVQLLDLGLPFGFNLKKTYTFVDSATLFWNYYMLPEDIWNALANWSHSSTINTETSERKAFRDLIARDYSDRNVFLPNIENTWKGFAAEKTSINKKSQDTFMGMLDRAQRQSQLHDKVRARIPVPVANTRQMGGRNATSRKKTQR